MGWFGGGSGSSESTSEKGFSDLGAGSSFAPDPSSSSPNMYGSSSGSNNGLAEFQEFSVNLQQQVLIQTVITELSHKAFKKCCGGTLTRDSQLTGKEVACVNAVTNKWLDANEFLAGRLQRKQQQQQSGGAAGQQYS